MANEKSTKASNNAKPFRYPDHPRPVTRRDLLRQGFISFAALSMLPRNFGFGTTTAFGQQLECGTETASFTPCMVFDMAGGAALPANFLVGKQGGPQDYLTSYNRLGWDPKTGVLDETFGIPMAGNGVSGLLRGLLETTQPETRKNFRMGTICHVGQDDSSVNKLSIISLVNKFGSRGKLISNGLGVVNRASGGNSDFALQDATLKPAFITNINDIVGAVQFGGGSFRGIRPEAVTALAKGGFDISRQQLAAYADLDNGALLKKLGECGYHKNLELVSQTTGVDPRFDTAFREVYGIDENTAPNTLNVITAGLSMNVLRGHCGPSVWTLGGCDYHDGTQTTGDTQDFAMGQQIGLAVEAARRLQTPFFFQLITDGGCGSEPGSRIWREDAGDKSLSVVGYYHPTKVPSLARLQVGHYTDGQGAAQNTLVGGAPIRAAYAAFANYLNVQGKLNMFHSILPNTFTDEELRSLIIFEEIT